MKMYEIRCKNPHPRLVGKPCNELYRIGATGGEVQIECERCRGAIHINFDETGTEAVDKVLTL